jgi:hypothetical protein
MLDEVGAIPFAAGLPVWSIKAPGLFDRRPSRKLEGARVRLFHHVLSLGATHLTYLQPESISLPRLEPARSPGTCTLAPDLDLDRLEREALHQGGWTLYAAPCALAPGKFPDPWHTTPHELLAAMREHGVSLLISSFRDDLDWRFAAPDYPLPEADATAVLALPSEDLS